MTNSPPSSPSDLNSSSELVCFLQWVNVADSVSPVNLILLRQLLIKVCTLLMVMLVVFRVCAPYSGAEFTLELNRRM